MNNWITQCYTRLLIDNHITEDDPSHMTRFDPAVYVALVKQAGVEAAMVYACCHNGNCYYPTRVGHMHANLDGRDIFGETVNLLRREGIRPIAYYTSIYHDHSAITHPAWRMTDAAGKQHGGRYWWDCPNNPEYTEFTRAQVLEVISYDVDGIFIDMTFWPVICHCPACRTQYRTLTGQEIPDTLDWSDPAWMRFQRFREESMTRFCNLLAEAIRATKDITVTFQNSTIISGWALGQDPGVANACDYTSGDFYGGKTQHILGAKILAAASKRQPYEYMTSRCVNLTDHTSMKAEAEMRCEAGTTLANGGAYFFIDAINPDGTLNPAVYQRLGAVASSLAPFTDAVRTRQAQLSAGTGLYFSMASLIDLADNGRKLRDTPESFNVHASPAWEELLGASVALTRVHRPFKVVRNAEGNLSQFHTLILNNIVVMSDDEIKKVRAWVKAGGTLIATGLTSLLKPDGTRHAAGNFGLADVFGVAYSGKLSRRVNFLVLPALGWQVLANLPAPLVSLNGAEALAGLSEPLFDPDDPQRWASIHSNPPGRNTGHPGLTRHTYGKGTCLYLASSITRLQQDAQQAFIAWLLAEHAPIPEVQTDAPVCVELTVLHSTTDDDLLVGLVNWQRELPNVPVHAVAVSVRLAQKPKVVSLVSNGAALPFHWEGGWLHLTVPLVETVEMVAVS